LIQTQYKSLVSIRGLHIIRTHAIFGTRPSNPLKAPYRLGVVLGWFWGYRKVTFIHAITSS